jgi:hypothetical protein
MASADGMNTYPTAMQFETLLYKHNNELYFSLAIYYKVIILVMLCYVMLCYVMLCYVGPCHHSKTRPRVADGGDGLKI